MKIILSTILLISTLFSDFKIGDTFPSLTLIDQFDKKIEVEIKGSVKVIISFEKEVSSGIKIFLDTQDDNFLVEHNITYISDISSVPSFLVNWVVLPKLKKFPFRVALMYDNAVFSNIKEGKVLLFNLEDGRVMKVEWVEVTTLKDKLWEKPPQ